MNAIPLPLHIEFYKGNEYVEPTNVCGLDIFINPAISD